ncbi:hypothetical protein C0993_006900 [Termitomyces sp. T159_Od127]|nr:hypothetical protein C0993_006900 [Termitomyces sp. T159_Od127]
MDSFPDECIRQRGRKDVWPQSIEEQCEQTWLEYLHDGPAEHVEAGYHVRDGVEDSLDGDATSESLTCVCPPSAALLLISGQRRHQLEGAPDPFPSLSLPDPTPKPSKAAQPPGPNELDSQTAFPALASSAPAVSAAPKSAWGSANGPRIKATALKVQVFADTFTLPALDLSNTGKDGKPATLSDIMRQVQAKYKVKLEASANQRTRQTTFHIKAEAQKELDKAKRSLMALLSPIRSSLANSSAQPDPSLLIGLYTASSWAKTPRSELKQFHDAHNIMVIFPNEALEQSTVVLVYDPSTASASSSPDDKQKHLDDVEKEILKLAKDAADVKSEKISVEARWHDAVVGQGGTTLNAIIGEDKTLSIKVGAEAGDPETVDVILVRGASADVDHAVKEILKIVENAKNDEIDNSHSTEFDIEREYVGRVVGALGAGINKLREQLGVRVDVSDEVDEKEKEKKKKAVHQKSRIKITGRLENVEEAKRRILSQVERLADETSEILKIPSQYHPSLIGQSGKYAIRLEEKYSVKITFPRHAADNGEGKTRESIKADEVLIKGGKTGVAGAKSELLEAFEFEKESNNILKFTVPTRSVARILGRGGASINEIKDTTEAAIDVEKPEDGGALATVTVRGTKKAINAAKAAILAIADQVAEETTASVVVESKYHRTLIGAGGQGLRDLVSRCGGPSDPKVQANLIRFPRQGEPSDEVRLRGEPKLVEKLKAELEKIVATLRDRVILGVDIPVAQHRVLIGRGGQNLNELQSKRDVQIQFPGSRSYNQVGEPENIADLAESNVANIVKVSGARAAVEATIEELKVDDLNPVSYEVSSSPAQSSIKPAAQANITETMLVPLKYHHAISQQGNFFRKLRSFGVQVDQSRQPSKSAVPTKPSSPSASTARIDEAEEEEAALKTRWEVVLNYQDVEEGDSTWTLKARDQAGLERAQNLIKEAISDAQGMSHVGFLTLSDRSVFPRIVGTKGANVARLRAETGADITVGREDNTIVIIGSESALEAAKDAIVKIASNPGRSRRNQD